MKPNELKKLRNEMGIKQKDLADILAVPFRTYQNWEQAEEKREHRKIPIEFAGRVRVLADFKRESATTGAIPRNLYWLQIPLLEEEIKNLKLRAELEEKSLSILIREKVIAILQSPLP